MTDHYTILNVLTPGDGLKWRRASKDLQQWPQQIVDKHVAEDGELTLALRGPRGGEYRLTAYPGERPRAWFHNTTEWVGNWQVKDLAVVPAPDMPDRGGYAATTTVDEEVTA